MADICETLEHSNLVYQVAVDLTRRNSERSESFFFEGSDLAEVMERTKQYLWTVPKKATVSVRGIVKVTNTFRLSGKLLDGTFKSLLQPEPMAEQKSIPQVVEGRPNPKPMLDSREAAEILGLKMQTLNSWRHLWQRSPIH